LVEGKKIIASDGEGYRNNSFLCQGDIAPKRGSHMCSMSTKKADPFQNEISIGMDRLKTYMDINRF
jgi:hypothetical protein